MALSPSGHPVRQSSSAGDVVTWSRAYLQNVLSKHVEKSPIPIRIAQQVTVEPHTQHRVLITFSASEIHNVKHKTLEKTLQMMFAAYDITDTLQLHPFYILLSNFSAKAMYLSKKMVPVYATDAPAAMMTPRSSPYQQFSTGIPKRVDNLTHSDANLAECDDDTTNDKEENVTNDKVGAFHYKHSTHRVSQIGQDVVICKNETAQREWDWQKEDELCVEYQTYLKSFISMMSGFQYK